MITTKTCSTCEHFPNDHHCVGCKWDEGKDENTKWELKKNPIVIERAVLDKIISEVTSLKISYTDHDKDIYRRGVNDVLKIIDKYREGKP